MRIHKKSVLTIAVSLLLTSACADTTDPAPDYDVREVVRINGESEDCLVANLGLQINDIDSPDVRLLAKSPCTRVPSVYFNEALSFEDVWVLAGVQEARALTFNLKNATSLNGLNQLERVDFRLDISVSDNLMDLSALSSVKEVGWRLDIQANKRLQSLRGLESLERVESLVIANNPSLESIDHFGSLQYVRKIEITGNPNLPSCEAEAFAARFEGIAEEIRVESNGGSGGCE